MKRRIIHIAALVLIGAMINLAVAWGCTTWDGLTSTGVRGMVSVYELGTPWHEQEWTAAFGPAEFAASFDDVRTHDSGDQVFLLQFIRQRRFGLSRDLLMDGLRSMPPSLSLTRVGWPLRAFRSESITQGQGSPVMMVTREQNMYVWRWPFRVGPTGARIELPYRPIYAGIAFNTLFYAALTALLFIGAGVLRRRRRIARGRCAHCAYDLRGTTHAQCPECGALCGKPLSASH